MDPLAYNYHGVLLEETGLNERDIAGLADNLVAARAEVLADAEMWQSGGAVPPEKQPLDAGFIDLPDRLLDEYRRAGETSEVGRILAAGKRMAEQVDRVVVLGIGGSYMGTRALFEACCHPYHNQLDRATRGDRPRLCFQGNNVDNDAMQGLLDLLSSDAKAESPADRFGLIVISKSGGTLETAVATRRLFDALKTSCGGDPALFAQSVIPVTGAGGRLFDLASALGCDRVFNIPDGVGGRFSILTAVGLLPAAVLGLDVVGLLEGAAEMNRRFKTAAPGDNPVLDYVAVGHLMEAKRAATIRVLSIWGEGLEAAGLWYDQLLAESLGKKERGAMPLTVVNTRDLHSRGQQHQEGRRDKLITNLIIDRWRREPIAVGRSENDEDQLNALADKTLPEVMAAAAAGTNRAYAEDGRPTADLHLPQIDETSLGQFFQMMMLATVVEGRLIGINPYGQPGVEAYKKHMNAYLRGS